MEDYWKQISKRIPNDHAEQYNAQRIAAKAIAGRRNLKVLDLGCGDGRGVDFFSSLGLGVDYSGVDIEVSPEVSLRKRDDATFDTFDGVNLPYASETFDIVYSNQVFEHVENPSALLKDVRRVLKRDGLFVGSVSQLEPYHSYSLWNFTLYGWHRMLKSSGLTVTEFRPGIDGVTLTMRSIDGRKARFQQFFRDDSPINRRIKRQGAANGASIQRINHRMICYAGHLCWIAKRTPRSKLAGDQPRPATLGAGPS